MRRMVMLRAFSISRTARSNAEFGCMSLYQRCVQCNRLSLPIHRRRQLVSGGNASISAVASA